MKFLAYTVAALALMVAQANAKDLKLAYPLAPTSHMGIGAERFADELEKRTNGELKVARHPSSTLGGERETIESAQLGTLDLVVTSTGPLGNFVKDTLVFDVPFLFRDYAHAHKVLDGETGQKILDSFSKAGMVGLAWGENGFRHLTNSVQAVTSPDDVKGLKIRTMENPVHLIAFRALGIRPTPMAWPELFSSLQQRVVDGQETPIPVIAAARFSEVQTHLALTGHIYSAVPFIVSQKTWRQLTPDQQKAMVESARIGAKAMREEVAKAEANGIAELKKQGMKVTEVDKARFRAAMEPAEAQYAKMLDLNLLAAIRAVK